MQVVVVGAGAFGGWTALQLLERGARVTLVDAWGPGNSRSSSGGETRIIRSMYGSDLVSTRMAARSLALWKEYQRRWKTPLYHRTGVLFLGAEDDEFLRSSYRALQTEEIPVELWSPGKAAARFPQISFTGIETALYEPDGGFLTARQNCQTVVEHFLAQGGRFECAAISPEQIHGESRELVLPSGERLHADVFVFACGPWMGHLFPDVLGDWIRPTKQDVLFFAPPEGDCRFAADLLPCWADRTSEQEFYGIPDVQNRGFKIAADLRGRLFGPLETVEGVERGVVERAREFLKLRFPALAAAPAIETRVCRYENSPDHAFIADWHPTAANLFLLGGGSGHGFKHGPAMGEYAAAVVLGEKPLDRSFALSRFQTRSTPVCS